MTPKDINEYIAAFPVDVRKILEQVRGTIRAAAPDAEETISYGIPTFRMKRNLVHFAAFKKHLGFYPTHSGVEAFKHELIGFGTSKGTVRFPLDKPIPFDLISRMVAFRVAEIQYE